MNAGWARCHFQKRRLGSLGEPPARYDRRGNRRRTVQAVQNRLRVGRAEGHLRGSHRRFPGLAPSDPPMADRRKVQSQKNRESASQLLIGFACESCFAPIDTEPNSLAEAKRRKASIVADRLGLTIHHPKQRTPAFRPSLTSRLVISKGQRARPSCLRSPRLDGKE